MLRSPQRSNIFGTKIPPQMEKQEPQQVRADVRLLRGFVIECFRRVAVSQEASVIAAEVLLESDLRGIESHGVARLGEFYIGRIRDGDTNPAPKVRVVHQAPATALIDGDGGMGIVVGHQAMELAIQKGNRTGAGFVAVTNSRHYGIAGYYSSMALARDMIGISMTNAPPRVLPTFGSEPMVGTNPISIAAPTKSGPPFVLDMATSVVAAGKFENAERAGTSIPQGWALDTEGQPTTDPVVAKSSRRSLPLGSEANMSSHKGYGLAVMVDILCGVLSGIGPSPMLRNNAGHFFGALRIDAFRPADQFKEMMDEMCIALRATPVLPGYDRVLVPGDPEFQTREERLKSGIPLHPSVVESLRQLGLELNVPLEL